MKALQYLSEDYLRECLKSTVEQRLEFLENLRQLKTDLGEDKTILISMKIKSRLLAAFRKKCGVSGVAYQTQIKALMRAFVE